MRILFAAILALLPTPAFADVSAFYTAGKSLLIVEVDDGGNARMGLDGKFEIIHRDGYDYAVMTTPAGDIKVTELGELLTFMSAAMGGAEGPGGAEGMKVQKFLLIDKGEVAVGERKGVLWNFGPETENDGRPGKMLEIVISMDPALAPIAALFRRTIETLLPVLSAMMPESSDFAPRAIELTAKGAPLRIDKLLELKSVSTEEIDSKRFELPAPVISANEFMMAMNPGGSAEFSPLP